MPWCPECGYEYKAEVGVCPDCGAELVEQDPREAPKPAPTSTWQFPVEATLVSFLAPWCAYLLLVAVGLVVGTEAEGLLRVLLATALILCAILPFLAAIRWGCRLRVPLGARQMLEGWFFGNFLQVLLAALLVALDVVHKPYKLLFWLAMAAIYSAFAVPFLRLGSNIRARVTADRRPSTNDR